MILDSWILVELSLAQKSPTMEAEFALDEKTALSLYDCLVPVLKEQRRFKIMPDTSLSISDFRTQLKVSQLQRELEQKSLPRMKKENERLKEHLEQLKNEVNIINWYLDIYEDGGDTKEVIEQYAILKNEHKRLKIYSTRKIKKLENNLAKYKEEYS